MKRHYTNYFKSISHFKAHRMKLVTSFELEEVRDQLQYILENESQFRLIE